MSSPVLDARDAAMNKTGQNSCVCKANRRGGGRESRVNKALNMLGSAESDEEN